MQRTKTITGIDISAETFSVRVITDTENTVCAFDSLPNNLDGFTYLENELLQRAIAPKETVICLEATGVYSEKLCYYFASKGFIISLVDPNKVSKDSPRKNDPLDAFRIAQYAYRYYDKLNAWQPKTDILEQIKVLLSTREHLTIHMTADQNALKALQRKHYQTPLANKIYDETIAKLKEDIKKIDNEIKSLIDKDDTFKQFISLARSVPGVGLLLASNLLILSNGVAQNLNYKNLAAYAGICPYEQLSGSSLNKKPRSKRYGPGRLRKLLFLSSLSLRTHNAAFKKYFLRKSQEGKSGMLILNNIANKLLKITCAVINSKTEFINNYQSVNPMFLKTA